MPRVLGIDQSLTATGLCRIDINQAGHSGGPTFAADVAVCTVSAPGPKLKTKREYSRRVTAVVDQIEGAMEGVDLVAMEEIAYGAKGAAAWVLPWLFGRIIDLCERHDKKLIVVNTSCVKKYATGNGSAGKDRVMLSVANRWPDTVHNNDEADALVCALVGCRHLGLPVDTVPKANLEFMGKISS